MIDERDGVDHRDGVDILAVLAPPWLGWLVLTFLGIGHVGKRLRAPGWLRQTLTSAALVLAACYGGIVLGLVIAVVVLR